MSNKKSAGPAPYFNVQSNYGESDKAQYAEHGVGWPFEGKKAVGVSLKMNSLPLGREMILFGKKGGDLVMFESSGNAPDYKLCHVDADQRYTEVGVGWSFDKRSKKDPEAVHGISFKLHARPLDGNLVVFEIDEQK